MINKCSDLNLPKYYVIHHCLLVACSLDSWLQADVYRQAAQQAYWTCHENATEREDEESLEILEGVRQRLDEVLEWKKAALAKFITSVEDEDNEDDEDEDEDEEEGDVDTDTFNNEDGDIDRLDESQTAAEAENEVDVAAETFELPIRSASKSPNSLA